MNKQSLLYLSKADVAQVGLDIHTVLKLVERAFHEKAAAKVEMPSKIGIHTMPDAFIHAMPAFIPGMEASGIKWVSSFPTNLSRGLPNIQGLIVLNDIETGVPLAVMDCTWITAYRTGAASALSARFLAKPDNRTAGIIACGAQGKTNLEALAAVFPLERAYVYDTSREAQEKYVAEMSTRLGLEVVGVQSPRQAVEGMDLVVTSGPIQRKAEPTIEAGWLKPGAFASSVDFGSYWTNASLVEMEQIATDDLAQFQFYRGLGYFDHVPEPYTDLAELVSGRVQGRLSDEARTFAINLGLALEDMAVAPQVYRKAKEMGIGTWLDL
ncbi:MAG: ornithine cyclodeaminase family protein [Chloroflexi bacterium]|nr:MAG: ornithine cyclodeaminase family protein [Chloroflexota bacterium]